MENPLTNVPTIVTTYTSKIKENINWNLVGLVAGILTVAVTIRNINNYFENLRQVTKK